MNKNLKMHKKKDCPMRKVGPSVLVVKGFLGSRLKFAVLGV